MKIAVIGAGFTGLTAALELTKKDHKVTIFEKESLPGGLAMGFKQKDWDWHLEKHYHHLFTSDWAARNLAQEVEVKIFYKRPKTKSLIKDVFYSLDSAFDVLKFNQLSPVKRIRMGTVLAYLKITPFWQPMEKISTSSYLKKMMGDEPYKILWKPLLAAKFGEYKDKIPLSWFWARIKKRSAKLGYPEGGFQNLADSIKNKIENLGGKFYFKTEVKEIKTESDKIRISSLNNLNIELFDKVIVTIPSSSFVKITPSLPNEYQQKLLNLKMLGALNLVLILKEPFLSDGTYWLNITNREFPFLAIVEHTNFVDQKYYNNQHIVYIGNYLPPGHPYMEMTAGELLAIYDPYLRKINPNYILNATAHTLFKDPFAQPVVTLDYSKKIPSYITPLKSVYLANMQQIYPWDRGTNYSVELGKKIAEKIFDK